MIDFLAQVGIRRDHRTRHRAITDCLKAYRAEDVEKKKRFSTARLLEGLAAWLQGTGYQSDRPLREALSDFGVEKVPDYLDPVIDYFEAKKAGLDNPAGTSSGE